MIRQVEIENFKSLKHTTLDFSNLTVLCGTNSGGKSTVIQALLLLRESYYNKSQFDYLDLKSNPVTIGFAKEALYQFSENNEIKFKIVTDNQTLSFCFQIRNFSKTLIHKLRHSFDYDKLNNEPLFSPNCQYISSARLSPQISYAKDDVVVDIYNQISEIDGKAEQFIHFLEKYKKQEVIESLRLANYETDLFSQVVAWEREISSRVNVVIKDNGILGYELKYQYDTTEGKTDEFRAKNVGFGLTYVAPVLVAILSAPKDAILFIENPEAHLHPKGQAKLAELIALAAQQGIQIVVETHSDHIFNGILVQCKKFELENKGIDRNNIKLWYFGEKDEYQASRVEEIQILEGGKIDKQPVGLFDQTQNDLRMIMGF